VCRIAKIKYEFFMVSALIERVLIETSFLEFLCSLSLDFDFAASMFLFYAILLLLDFRLASKSRAYSGMQQLSTYLICQCSEYDDCRASIELSYGCAGAAPVNWTPENTNTPARRTERAKTESIMPLYLIAG
jgi:hypothetical protein